MRLGKRPLMPRWERPSSVGGPGFYIASTGSSS
jgi:hypothetical protein